MKNTITHRSILIHRNYLSLTTCLERKTVQSYKTLGSHHLTLRAAKKAIDGRLSKYYSGKLSDRDTERIERALAEGIAEGLELKKEKLGPGRYRVGRFTCEDWTPPAHTHARCWVVLDESEKPVHETYTLKQALLWAKLATAKANQKTSCKK